MLFNCFKMVSTVITRYYLPYDVIYSIKTSYYLSEEFVEEESGGQENEADLHVLGSVHTYVGG